MSLANLNIGVHIQSENLLVGGILPTKHFLRLG